ncbi:hypothetical protein P1X15_00500 [Runella sp. MFBS21]|uniref:hypothetical protein n=1 Tax=Runella sp. MFBS21 TaxID=3034018 RepID=UPI0023F999F9|nr:hypothetical protein [Runella sp. MFBS21]MDF7816041.1 hypothetical protein [Runella sp. MFBS21]
MLLVLSVLVVIISVLLLGVRLIFVKNGEFKGSCANNNPFLQKDGIVCGVCGKKVGEACSNKS